jgi:hypothetical protein
VLSRSDINCGSLTPCAYQYVLSDGVTMNNTNVWEAVDIGAAYAKVAAEDPDYPLGFIAHSEVCLVVSQAELN